MDHEKGLLTEGSSKKDYHIVFENQEFFKNDDLVFLKKIT
jgi:hypothetical protein